jgi:hypothetical protein
MNKRPTRNQISKKTPMPVWRIPLSGYVTPRLQAQKSSGPTADAIGFLRLEEGANWQGAWVRKPSSQK